MATVLPAEQAPLVLSGYTWAQYQSIEELFSDSGVRVRFLDHQIEIMAPVSEEHEERKSHLGRLVEVWCLYQGIRFCIRGNTTLLRPENAGGEPDESYCFGEKKTIPDLAIEVALTSGGLSKRAFYAKFAVPELWIWRRHRLEVFVWEAATASYAPSTASLVLPGLDLSLLEECARMDYASDAIREFDKRIRVTEGG